MKNIIDENSEFRWGEEIYIPRRNEYLKVVTSYYVENYKEIIVFLLPLNTFPEGNVFSYRLSRLISEGF